MKRLMPLFLALFVLSALGCEKEENPDCLTGFVRFTNNSSNPYELYINNQYETQIRGNSSMNLSLDQGSYQVKAVQVSGYLIYPTVKTATINVFGCQEGQWVFP